jgi:hypothetical protein
MSIFGKKIPSPKKEKVGFRERIKGIGRGLKERVSKSPAVHTYKRVKQIKERPLFPNRPAEKQYKTRKRAHQKATQQYTEASRQYQKDMARYNATVLNKPPLPIEPTKPSIVAPTPPPKPLLGKTLQEIAAAEQKKNYPAKQIKKTIVGAGHLITSQDRPFSSVVKSAGFGGRGGGSRRGRSSSPSKKQPSLKAWGEEGVDL